MRILGVDIGISRTKFALTDGGAPLSCGSIGQDESFTDALGRYLTSDVSAIALTGIGAPKIGGVLCGRTTYMVGEFDAMAAGVRQLTGLTDMLVVSLGTGTAFVRVTGDRFAHLGGSGVGGGTLLGLSRLLCGTNDAEQLAQLALRGDLSNIDLTIGDVTDHEIPNLPPHTTAANLAKASPDTAIVDRAAGILNLLFQTIGMMSVFALKDSGVSDAVLIGTAATLPQAVSALKLVQGLHGIRFHIPQYAPYAVAIGAAMLIDKKCRQEKQYEAI